MNAEISTVSGTARKQLLVIDDEENMRHMLTSLLSRFDYEVDVAANGQQGLSMALAKSYDFILCDIRMPVMDGMEFLQAVNSRLPAGTTTIITMSAYGNLDSALESMKLGAYDYISKPFKADEILLVLRKAEERELLRRENHALREQIEMIAGPRRFGEMIAESRAMQSVFALAEKVAAYKTTVLITGESGTGKEMIARGLHHCGDRSQRPFVAVNCGGIPENLLESELFGYKRGAFTGAVRDRQGLFQAADGGTLFLDEIGEMPTSLQVKLLRVLQEEEVRAIGSDHSVRFDVRVVAATSKDLPAEIRRGAFREDLFYRLNVMPIRLPPLREHPEDLAPLCRHFIARFNRKLARRIEGLHPAAMARLARHSWPGNVRELENLVERAILLCEGPLITAGHLPAEWVNAEACPRVGDEGEGEGEGENMAMRPARERLERRLIERALQATGGNRTRAVELLGISHPSLLSKIKAYGIKA